MARSLTTPAALPKWRSRRRSAGEITDELDAAGNTAKAITKGFSIGAAGLTVISLLGAFLELVEGAGATVVFDVMNPMVFFGILVGAAIPAVFSAMLMNGVNRNSQVMVKEIHRQFNSIPGLREGTSQPDYAKCIDISTRGAIRELIPAGLFTILMTLVVGFIGGPEAIGGFLVGNIVTGLLLALLMSNAGGLWDNAKKFVESGNFGGKGSDAHKAAVIGDTVGDPFKDTAGRPSTPRSPWFRSSARWPRRCSSASTCSKALKQTRERLKMPVSPQTVDKPQSAVTFLKNRKEPKNQKEKAAHTSNITTSTQPERNPGGEGNAQAAGGRSSSKWNW